MEVEVKEERELMNEKRKKRNDREICGKGIEGKGVETDARSKGRKEGK